MAADDLIGVTEIARVHGVAKNSAWRWTKRAGDFPEPALELASGRVWRRADVEAWAKRTLPLPAGRPRSRDRDAKSARTPEEIAAVAGEALALLEQRTRGQAGRSRRPREPRP